MSLPVERIAAWLGERDRGAVEITGVEKLGGGAIQENWGLSATIGGERQELVLRTSSPSGIAVSWSREQEYAVLQIAYEAGVKAPEPMRFCDDVSVIGKPFYLMRRAPGEARGHKLVRDDRVGSWGNDVAAELGRQLALLHKVSPEKAALEFMPFPQGPPFAGRIAEYRHFLDELDEPQPVIEYGLSWLERHPPEPFGLSLLHCDYRTGNYLVHEGRLTAILDWEFAAYGDPLEDVSWFLARCWRFGAWQRQAGGVGSVEAFLAGYEEISSSRIPRDRLPAWQLMATIRWAVIALMQTKRHYSGAEASLELALIQFTLPQLEWDIMEQTESGDLL
ncbi:MAG: phosphotransferase family protein [Geminicoccaceae bacterium]